MWTLAGALWQRCSQACLNDPRHDPKLIALVQGPRARCGGGWAAKLLALVETVVYAQSDSCNNSSCGQCEGSNWTPGTQTCPGPPCNNGEFHRAVWTAYAPTGVVSGCQSACGCPNICPTDTCTSSSPPPPQCQSDSDCGWGRWCSNGQCVNSNCGVVGQSSCLTNSNCDEGWTCNHGCCELVINPPPPPPIGCDPNNPPSCQCGYSCFANLFWICNTCGGGGGGSGGCENPGYCWGDWDCCGDDYCDDGSCTPPLMDPILLDLEDEGIVLTSPANGVLFDFFGRGNPRRISWTAAGSHNAWLVLDLNRNGQVDSGIELFGNSMPQPGPRGGRIGFSALAQFDTSQQGGNGDGAVDGRDAVYRYLVLWTDVNHNGISEAAELQPLDQAGVVSISLKHKEWKRTDAFGNQFRYRSQFHTERRGLGKDHWVYDVVLVR